MSVAYVGVEFQQRQRLEFGGVMTERGRVSGKATTEVKDGSGRSWRKVSEWIERLSRRCESKLTDFEFDKTADH